MPASGYEFYLLVFNSIIIIIIIIIIISHDFDALTREIST